MADKDLDLSFRPDYLEGDKKFVVGGGRVTGRKRLDSGSEVEAFADVQASYAKGAGTKISTPRVGASYRKDIDKDSSVEISGSKGRRMDGEKDWSVGVSYEKRFSKGGMVQAPASEPKRSYPKKK